MPDDDLKKLAMQQVQSGTNPYLHNMEPPPGLLDYARQVQQEQQTFGPPAPKPEHSTTYGPPGSGRVQAPPESMFAQPFHPVDLTPQGQQQPAAPPTKPQKTGSSAAVPGATPMSEIGAYKEQMASDNATRAQEKESMGREQAAVDKEQAIRQVGQDAADASRRKADAEYQVAQSDYRGLERDAVYQANVAAGNRKARAELLEKKEIDPNRWYKHNGTAGNILAALSIGAGAFAAAMPHTGNHTNQALEIINNAINKDIDAQKADIDNQWKALDYQGSEDEKEYVRNEHFANQTRDRALMDYQHAIAQTDYMIKSTDNQAAITGLTKVREGLEQKKQGLEKEEAQQRLNVRLKEIALAKAAAAKNTVNPKEITAYAQKLYADPNFQAPSGMSREQAAVAAAQSVLTGGKHGIGASVAKPGTNPGSKDFDQAVESVGKDFDEVGKNNALFAINPYGEDAAAIRKREQTNANIIALVHGISPGLRSPEIIKETTEPYMIKPTDKPEIIQQKKEALQKYLKQHRKLEDKKSKPEDIE